jgi:hypothetical protein
VFRMSLIRHRLFHHSVNHFMVMETHCIFFVLGAEYFEYYLDELRFQRAVIKVIMFRFFVTEHGTAMLHMAVSRVP